MIATARSRMFDERRIEDLFSRRRTFGVLDLTVFIMVPFPGQEVRTTYVVQRVFESRK